MVITIDAVIVLLDPGHGRDDNVFSVINRSKKPISGLALRININALTKRLNGLVAYAKCIAIKASQMG